MDERADWLRLIKLPGLAVAAKRRLLARFGSPAAVLGASGDALEGVAARHVAALAAGRQAEVDAELAWLAGGEGRDLVTLADPRYPPQLAATPGAPLALFTIGDAAQLAARQVAIVGSRNPTPAGAATATALAAALAKAGIHVTSGLAVGIDAAAHHGALAGGGATVAVTGCGPDRIYPRANTGLFHAIAGGGGVIASEFVPGTPPIGANFPRRNAVIAGLALGVLVVEAAKRSGSLITARQAGDMGREVFAVPGPIQSPLTKGAHRLLRDGAKLVETVEDILEELPDAGADTVTLDGALNKADSVPAASGVGTAATKFEKTVLDAIGFTPAAADEIIGRTGLDAQTVSAILMEMELRGVVAICPGGSYVRVPASAQQVNA
ncbi:MAG: DNA-processing protein DprA [Gammaproteobacteria bacterium]|nr:DNA-processing protein DprA [Gammaproteobacteria bacterium]MDD9870503.1 DNA-processing protein DprA [Gammaproteobacteria bacterium]